jgi:hypothetical protein
LPKAMPNVNIKSKADLLPVNPYKYWRDLVEFNKIS